MAGQQVQPQDQPSLQQQVIELRGFQGLNVREDIANRPLNSWRRLDNFDLYIPGSIRKIEAPALLSGAFPVVILAQCEFRSNDSGVYIDYGIGTDGKIYDLSNPATPGISLGVGSVSIPPWLAVVPGTKIPFNFITWQKSLAVLVGDAVAVWAVDGNRYIFKCTTPGNTSGTASPAWPTSGTVADGGVTWTNQGLQDQQSYIQNYLVIIVPGQQPLKFDGTSVTQIGVSGPQVPVNIVAAVQSSTLGIQYVTGAYYAWTWFNPVTLHESAPSPVIGALKGNSTPVSRGTPAGLPSRVPFYSSTEGGTFSVLGSWIGPTATGVMYSSVELSIPLAALTPPIGSGYTHIRMYRTRDGGSQLYLLQTLFSVSGDQVCDANGGVKISTLATISGYEAVQVTQPLATQVTLYDGVSTGSALVTQDSMAANNDLFVRGTVADVTLITGTLTLDTDPGSHLTNRAAYMVTSQSFAATAGTSWTLEVRFRCGSSNGGGVMASINSASVFTPGVQHTMDRCLFMQANGRIRFAYHDSVSNAWTEISSLATGWNDGNNHVVDIVGDPGVPGVDMYIDGVHQSNNALLNNPGFTNWLYLGIGELIVHPGVPNSIGIPNHFTGTLDEVAYWTTTALSAASVAANAAAAIANANYGAFIIAKTPTDYWRLDDLSSVVQGPQTDAQLIFPAPAITDHFPPPVGRWGALFQASLVVQDDEDAATIWSSDTGDFESFGQFGFDRFQTENDDDVMAMVGGLNLLVVSTIRRVDSLSGADESQFVRQPIDSLHGFLGHRCVFPLGSRIVGLMQQGFAAYDLSMSFGATSGNVQLGYGDATLIGDDILPVLRSIQAAANQYLTCIAIDNTRNILLFAIKDASGVTYNDVVLMFTMGKTPGWSKFIPPSALEYPSIREMVIPDGSMNILAGASNKNVYKLFSTQTPLVPLVAVAETQAIPVPAQTGPELWDVDREFLYMYVEGQDLANFTYQFSIDGGAFTLPALPLQASGLNRLGGHGKQIVIRFTHAVNPTVAPALISYIKVGYNISSRRS